ncbi:spermine oxidase-like [Anopheles albimanus]|uniref:spermine oxidase-like n=1 Tax=Anopheles albimanus TaxID=7167 RepID=UPI001640B9D1|nr:spermine oxidase-like [Anopheles albimanus]
MKWTLAAVYGLLLAATLPASTAAAAGNPRIVIVGAGVAGVTAASSLYRAGLTNITVLEASQRIGGRIRTIPFGDDGPVELGAQWCHGEGGNVAYEMASVFPGLLKTSMFTENDFLVQSNGQKVPEEISDRLWELAQSIVESTARDTNTGTLGDFVTTRYRSKILSDPEYSDINRQLAEQFLVSFHNSERGHYAYDSWYDVAASTDDDYVETEGEQALAWTGRRGFSSILDIITGSFPGSTKSLVPINQLTKFNKVVSNIRWRGTTDGYVKVTTEDGSLYNADHVIVTVSLGVLKATSRAMFTPALPTINQNAIDGINFGTVNKVFMFFDAPIPAGFGNVVNLLWFDRDLQALRQSKHAWAEAVGFFYRIDSKPYVLCAWLNGAQGRQAELLSDATVQEGLLYLLSLFGRNYKFGNVQSILRSKWSSDRFIRGSYSSRSITTERLETGPNNLARPLRDAANEPLVMFAGEAASATHYSTVHGAMETAQREATRLINLYK